MNEHYSEEKQERFCVSGCAINLLCHMGCKDWGLPKFELGNLYPYFQSCVKYFKDNNCNVVVVGKLGLTKSLTEVTDLLSFVTIPAMLSLKSDDSPDNHVVCVWQNHIIDYESQFTYELSIQGLWHACGTSTVIVQSLEMCFIRPTKRMRKLYGQKKLGGKEYDWKINESNELVAPFQQGYK